MPVLPGITDAPDQIDALVRQVAAAKASYLGACALRLRSTARQRYLPFIEAEFPELAMRYRSTYARGHQVGERYRDGLRDRFREVCAKHGVVFDSYYRVEDDDVEDDAAVSTPEAETSPSQLAFPL
jgi:DNA repair photolyase